MASTKETALQHCKSGIKRLLAIFAFLLDSVLSLKYLFRDTNRTFRDLNNILVLEIQGFGDALLSLASLNQIKKKFPEKKITILVQGDNAQFFQPFALLFRHPRQFRHHQIQTERAARWHRCD